MIADSPNIFNALFAFHPREGYTPRENFLSEAFAHVLRTVDGACEAWVSRLAGKHTPILNPQIFTRRSEDGVFPDMKIEATTSDGKLLRIYSEHKWDSPCNERQLRFYADLATKAPGGALLAFVGARFDQIRKAKEARTAIPCHALRWEDVYMTLEPLKKKDVVLDQFLDFMETHGLSPGKPITVRQMQAFLESSDFLSRLHHYASKLLIDYSWTQIPERYRSNSRVEERYGRVGLLFDTPDWAPAITTGFLYSIADHRVSFTSPNEGIDFFLRIECNPDSNPNPHTVLSRLGEKTEQLRQLGARVLLKGEIGNGNPWNLFIAQKSLATLIRGKSKEREHLDAIYETLSRLLTVLFSDGQLEKSLKAIKP